MRGPVGGVVSYTEGGKRPEGIEGDGGLYQRVSESIWRAERAKTDEEAERWWHTTSLLEAEIAAKFPAGTVEGDIARRGVVSAALAGHDAGRALLWAEMYLDEEGVTDQARETLTHMAALARVLVEAELLECAPIPTATFRFVDPEAQRAYEALSPHP